MVANAITDKGVETASDATFATMAENIGKIATASGDTVQYGICNSESSNTLWCTFPTTPSYLYIVRQYVLAESDQIIVMCHDVDSGSGSASSSVRWDESNRRYVLGMFGFDRDGRGNYAYAYYYVDTGEIYINNAVGTFLYFVW